jgi:2-hydroxy-6-oxonona-2,4-dienedioate hydrolase
VWRLALRAATETRRRPLCAAPLAGRVLETPQGPLWARVSPAPHAGAPAIVLVHGVIVSGRYLLPAAVGLARACAVVVPDLPGYGLSAAPAESPSIGALADAVIGAAHAAGHPRVALVANSFGAQVATTAAVRHPAAVERLVLIGPTVDPAARNLPAQALRWLRCFPDEDTAVLAVMARDVADVGVLHAAHLLRVMLHDRIEERLPDVRQPTLVIRGERDRIVPQRWAQEAAHLLPDGRLVVLPGQAHMPHWSRPEALVTHLRAFLGA